MGEYDVDKVLHYSNMFLKGADQAYNFNMPITPIPRKYTPLLSRDLSTMDWTEQLFSDYSPKMNYNVKICWGGGLKSSKNTIYHWQKAR